MEVKEYTKSVLNLDDLHDQLVKCSATAIYSHLGINSVNPTKICMYTTAVPSGAQQTVLDGVVTDFVDNTTPEGLKIYLDEIVFPFIDSIIHKFASENISMGITFYDKTSELMGLFAMPIDIEGNNFPFSLKSTFDTGSLKESLKLLQYFRDRPAMTFELLGLHTNGFINDARLLAMKNEIETFLSITPLST